MLNMTLILSILRLVFWPNVYIMENVTYALEKNVYSVVTFCKYQLSPYDLTHCLRPLFLIDFLSE